MKFRVKDMDIATGGPYIAIINQDDASFYDLHHADRLRIRHNSKSVVAAIDIAKSKKVVPKGYIGIFEEILAKLGVKKRGFVNVTIEKKPDSLYYIRKKLNGERLNEKEIDEIIKDIVNNRLNEVELTYFVSACYTNLLNFKETVALTKAIINNGVKLNLKRYPILDKHCSGGVAGNRTTMIIVPIIAAAGLTIPKTSSRSITSPAGTADTVEVLTNVCVSLKKMKSVVRKTNGCLVWGGSINLAPADDKIIKVEKLLSIDAKSQLIASILAKKASVNTTHLLVDIPVGKGTKIVNKKHARSLKKLFIKVGKQFKMKVKVITTNGNEPIGNGLGPVLEAKDVLYVLRNDPRAPKDLKEKSIMMADVMLKMVGKRKDAREILESGKAYEKFIQIMKEQGGKEIEPDEIRVGRYFYDVKAKKSGKIIKISNRKIAKTARIAGAPEDKQAGIYLYHHINEKVKRGEILFTVYSDNNHRLKFALEFYNRFNAIKIK